MSEEEKEALKSIKYQLENDYIDISGGYPNELEFNIVKKAVEFYENVKLSGKYQELEKENKELRNNKKLFANINIALDDMKEYIDGEINNILIENYIPKEAIRVLIKQLKSCKEYDYVGNEWKDSDVVDLLQELLESEE